MTVRGQPRRCPLPPYLPTCTPLDLFAAVDQLAEESDGALNTLMPGAQQTHQYQRQLGEIEAKWRYIEPSLRNYQSSAIPSLVNRYSARIIETIARLPLASAESEANVSR
jgi:hypothetical protein